MNAITRLVQVATALQAKKVRCVAVEAHTPDGRCWSIDTGLPGLRLREVDRETGETREHDHPDGEWTANEIAEYLAGCGARDDEECAATHGRI